MPEDKSASVLLDGGTRLGRYAMFTLWPAFMLAAVTTGLIFSWVDPANLDGWGGALQFLPPAGVYSMAFMALWLLFSLCSAITVLLMVTPDPVEGRHSRAWPR
ncbi:hypothetical protein ACG0Z6_14610 [Roseateles sp. BYS180W]|uniref:Transmembrane protein n=1 Tax=Roseateles rivi TaxID=3299028 RepID=A0ABW7FYT0_9BURK